MAVAVAADRYDDTPDWFRQRHTSGAWRQWRYHQKRQEAVCSPEPEVPQGRKRPASDDEWEDLFAAVEAAEEAREPLSSSQKSTMWRSPDGLPVGICFVSDVHAGAGGVDYRRFRDDVQTICDTPGLYVVFNGDLLENTKTSLKSATALYSAAFPNPQEQEEYVRRRLAICRDKIIALAQGNHDAFDYRTGGIDRVGSIAAHLGVPYFTEAGGSILATVGTYEYHIIVKHDYQGKSKLNKSNSARRLFDEWPWEWDNAHVVALAHLHEPDCHNTLRKGKPVAYVRGGTYKERDAWAESGGYRPSYGVPLVLFWPDEEKVLAWPGHLFDDGVAYLRLLRATRRV